MSNLTDFIGSGEISKDVLYSDLEYNEFMEKDTLSAPFIQSLEEFSLAPDTVVSESGKTVADMAKIKIVGTTNENVFVMCYDDADDELSILKFDNQLSDFEIKTKSDVKITMFSSNKTNILFTHFAAVKDNNYDYKLSIDFLVFDIETFSFSDVVNYTSSSQMDDDEKYNAGIGCSLFVHPELNGDVYYLPILMSYFKTGDSTFQSIICKIFINIDGTSISLNVLSDDLGSDAGPSYYIYNGHSNSLDKSYISSDEANCGYLRITLYSGDNIVLSEDVNWTSQDLSGQEYNSQNSLLNGSWVYYTSPSILSQDTTNIFLYSSSQRCAKINDNTIIGFFNRTYGEELPNNAGTITISDIEGIYFDSVEKQVYGFYLNTDAGTYVLKKISLIKFKDTDLSGVDLLRSNNIEYIFNKIKFENIHSFNINSNSGSTILDKNIIYSVEIDGVDYQNFQSAFNNTTNFDFFVKLKNKDAYFKIKYNDLAETATNISVENIDIYTLREE